ncbi:MAG TPA: hypothetical protein VFI25_16930 [Planctomycetota bacterium]|jgi:hypothetical protein|nr:hypothetical protein [Planctomycetota bacterium]
MPRIFSSLLLACLALFLCAASTALRGGETHALLGLSAAIFAVLCHALLFIYLIGTGKTLKEAVESRGLEAGFLQEWRRDLARAVAPGGLGVLAVTAAAVVSGFDAPWVRRGLHPALAILALGVTVWALVRELGIVASNRDRIRRALEPLGAAAAGDAPPRSRSLYHALLLSGLTALGVYPYARFVAREANAPAFPFVPLGALLVLGGLLVRRKERAVR